MQNPQVETGAAPSDACCLTLESFMSLTHQERRDMLQALHEATWACHVVMMMMNSAPPMSPAILKNTCDRYAHGNKAAARIAHDYLTLGKDVKLPIVPPEWLQAVKNAQSETGAAQ